jgi:ribosome-associated protein
MEKVKITTEFIKLDQFLKWIGIVDSGVAGKVLVQQGQVKVNGNTELQRGKKIRPGDVITIGSQSFEVE